jgi:hypothetical protein
MRAVTTKIVNEERREALMHAIRDHLSRHGAKEWSRVEVQFPEISKGMLWRAIKQVREERTTAPEILVGAIKHAKRVLRKHLPAVVSPEYFAKGGVAAIKNTDFLGIVSDLHRDIDMIREFATVVNEDGEEKIKNPNFFVKAVQLRMELQRVQVSTAEKVYQMQQSREYWDTIIEEIGKESKECQHRIVQRIAVLNARRGMTINAGEVYAPPPTESTVVE